MIRKQWFAVLALLLGLAVILLMGAERSHPATTSSAVATSLPNPDPTCGSLNPCLEWDNTSTGAAIKGQSTAGNGLNGATKLNSTTKGKSGVVGQDLSTTPGGFNAGVFGTSTLSTGVFGSSSSGDAMFAGSATGAGIVAVTGSNGSTSNGHYGVYGSDASTIGTSNFGVVGVSTNGTGTNGFSTTGTGVSGTALANVGVSGFTSSGGAFPYAVSGLCACPTPSPGIGVAGFAGASVGTGVYGAGLTGVWADGHGSSEALRVTQASTGALIIATNSSHSDVMSLDQSGNMILKGALTQHGTPLIATQTSSGVEVSTFSAQQTMPTIEDFGQAQLVEGRAYVHIDQAFVSTIDPRAGYLVFLTPAGDSRGLYATNRTSSGFLVRENQGGRSTLVFDYRIVAHPLNVALRRLPLATSVLRTTRLIAIPKPPPPPIKPIAPLVTRPPM